MSAIYTTLARDAREISAHLANIRTNKYTIEDIFDLGHRYLSNRHNCEKLKLDIDTVIGKLEPEERRRVFSALATVLAERIRAKQPAAAPTPAQISDELGSLTNSPSPMASLVGNLEQLHTMYSDLEQSLRFLEHILRTGVSFETFYTFDRADYTHTVGFHLRWESCGFFVERLPDDGCLRAHFRAKLMVVVRDRETNIHQVRRNQIEQLCGTIFPFNICNFGLGDGVHFGFQIKCFHVGFQACTAYGDIGHLAKEWFRENAHEVPIFWTPDNNRTFVRSFRGETLPDYDRGDADHDMLLLYDRIPFGTTFCSDTRVAAAYANHSATPFLRMPQIWARHRAFQTLREALSRHLPPGVVEDILDYT